MKMTDVKWYGNELFDLQYLSSFMPSDIDQDDFDVCGEDENGNEVCVEVSIVDLALRSMKAIEALQAENERLKVLLARHNDGVLRLIGLSDKRERIRVGETMREETPEMMQSLINKLKADAVREACEIAASCLSCTDTAEMMHDAIISYADSLDATKLEAGE